jgi:hypothetical protein
MGQEEQAFVRRHRRGSRGGRLAGLAARLDEDLVYGGVLGLLQRVEDGLRHVFG